jgi:polar amino acid transport system substrate-binding protein
MRAVTTGAPARRGWVVARAAVALAVAGLVAGACSQTDVPASLPGPTTTTTEPDPPPVETPDCDPATVTRSLPPDAAALAALESGEFDPTSMMAEIRDRGRLRVGVDTSTLRFSHVNPSTGGFEGFDIDIAREIAAALFGSPDKIEFVAIPYSERVNVLVASEVDIVVDTFTINCVREEQIDFSTEYFTSSQKLLVPLDAGVTRIEDLAGEPVCAAAGSTSIDNINALPEDQRPVAVGVTEQADCLVLLQQGRVAGISTDDTILAGMVAQDPNVTIVGEPFSAEPYGVGLPPDREEFVRYVNAVLDRVRSSGRWTELYNQWLAGLLPEQNVTPPAAQYED